MKRGPAIALDEPDLIEAADARDHEQLRRICAGYDTRSARGRERLRDYTELTHKLLGAKP